MKEGTATRFITKPYRLIEWGLAILMIVAGVVISLTANQPTAASGPVAPYITPLIVLGMGLGMLGGGGALVFGLKQNNQKVRGWALLVIYLVNIFSTLIDIFAIGFGSWLWLDTLVVSFVSAIIWLRIRWEQKWLT